MKEKKKTAYECFMETVNRYEVKEIRASDLGHFYVRCATKNGKTILYKCIEDEIEEQFIPEKYEELIKSERFLLSMIKYLVKEDYLDSVAVMIKWHDYQVYHAPEAKEPSCPFCLYDVWNLNLEPTVNLNEFYEGKK